MSDRLNITDYPNIDPPDVGEHPNIVYGTTEGVRSHAIVAGAASPLSVDITAVATSITVIDASYYPAAPFVIQIEDERINVTSKSGNTFDVVTRGYDNTTAVLHKKNQTSYEVLIGYAYLVADHAVKSIDAVYIDDKKQLNYTAYTGYDGDDYPGIPDKAIVFFPAEAYIGQQYNVENAGDRDSGITTTPVPIATSSKNILYLSANINEIYYAGQEAWAEYALEPGVVVSQKYTMNIEEHNAEPFGVRVVVTENGIKKLMQEYFGEDDEVVVDLTRSGGVSNDKVSVVVLYGTVIVNGLQKEVTVREERYGRLATQSVTAFAKKTFEGSNWAEYDDTPLGEEIVSQKHSAFVSMNSGVAGIVRMSAVDASYNERAHEDYEVDYGGGQATGITLSVEYDGGDWEDKTIVSLVTLDGYVGPGVGQGENRFWKEITYNTEATLGDAATATSSSHVVVGDTIRVDGEFAIDEDGNYGGAGNLIERPDWVIKHFLIVELGFTAGEIDATSFTAAGSDYNSDGYIFGFIWHDQDVSQMASECRSTLRYRGGDWYLDRLPDAAPAAIKTITLTEVVTQFTFDKMSIKEIANNLLCRYKYDEKEGSYVSTVTDTDATSISKYGTWKDHNIELEFVRDATMAASVLAHVLLQRKNPLKTIRFDVPFEHFDLEGGDTFDITNDFYNAEKYYIENIERDKKTATITGKEWW